MKSTLSSKPQLVWFCRLLKFDVSRLDNQGRERMRHMRCICFLRPSSDNIQYLIEELREPKYGEYGICTLSGLVKKDHPDLF